MSYYSMLKNTAKVYRKTTNTGQAIENWQEISEIKCLIVSISFNDAILNELTQLRIDHKMYIPPKTDVKTGDKIVSDGTNFILKKIDNICQMGRVIECWMTKL